MPHAHTHAHLHARLTTCLNPGKWSGEASTAQTVQSFVGALLFSKKCLYTSACQIMDVIMYHMAKAGGLGVVLVPLLPASGNVVKAGSETNRGAVRYQILNCQNFPGNGFLESWAHASGAEKREEGEVYLLWVDGRTELKWQFFMGRATGDAEPPKSRLLLSHGSMPSSKVRRVHKQSSQLPEMNDLDLGRPGRKAYVTPVYDPATAAPAQLARLNRRSPWSKAHEIPR
ncbi:hypothetical protein DL93DRAFT_2157557 [Clavulina sp. PMI_390]|nr:hypothetical protein DL93DRAFT_2157557 [Clavulina sp. PMI_390]